MRERFSCSRWMAFTLPVAASTSTRAFDATSVTSSNATRAVGELLFVRADLLVQSRCSCASQRRQLVDAPRSSAR